MINKEKIITILHKLYQKISPLIRKNKLINFFLFGFMPIDNKLGEYWDWTTLSIRKMMKKYVKNNMTILDIGTGPYGVLSLYAILKLKPKSVTGIDHSQILIDNAKKYKDRENIMFLQSDLFENVEDSFDIILFNAPYIDLEFGKEIGVLKDTLSTKRWSGGDKGIQTVEKFLFNLPSYLKSDGIAILGVNHFYIEDELIRKTILKAELHLIEVDKNNMTKACSYIIKK